MTSQEFVERIAKVVYAPTVDGCLSVMNTPPGRKPSRHLLALSEWFNQLDDSDRARVRDVVELAAGASVFGMLAVLDGVRHVEDTECKGTFELRFSKDGHSHLINDPAEEMLHDLFGGIVPPA